MNQHHRHDISDGDEQSEDGQLRTPQHLSADADKNSNDDDTPDSLEIKPPQSNSRYGKIKKSSSSRDRKHSREHRHKERAHMRSGVGAVSDREVRQERHHMHGSSGGSLRHSVEQRYHTKTNVGGGGRDPRDPREQRDSARDSREQMERYEKIHAAREREMFNKGAYNEREREKLRVKGYERKRESPEKSEAERKLEDLRSKLLSKRSKHDIERKIEEHQTYQEYTRANDKEFVRYEQYESRRTEKEFYQQKHRSKRNPVEMIDSPENYSEIDMSGEKTISERHRTQEDPELMARRAKLLDAEREMSKRKQMAREELKARREMQRERDDSDQPSPPQKISRKHHRSALEHKTKNHSQDDIVHISDNSDNGGDDIDNDDDEDTNCDNDEQDDEEDEEDGEEDDTASDSGTNTNSEYSDREENSEEEELPASPLSIGELTKSDHRRKHSRTKSRSVSKSKSRSRSRSRSRQRSGSRSRTRTPSRSPRVRNRSRQATPTSDFEKDKVPDRQIDEKVEQSSKKESSPVSDLPSYYPGLQGCRSVEEFKCLNRIAEGTYGIVYRAQDKRTEEIVALKRLKMEKEKDGFPITSLREINTLLKGQHPNIVTVREIVVGSNMDKIFIVMDYVEHDFKTLMETMQHRKQSFLPGEVKCLTQQLLKAVAHLHDNWILHRDLKTSNLLLSHKGILKVGDFGLAREYGSPLKPYTSVVVTLWYRAPELLLCCKEYSTPIDMWSVGCIFAEFLAMQALFPGQSETDQLNKIFKFLGTPNENIWPGYGQLPAVQKIKFTEFPVSMLREKFSRRTSELGLNLLQGLLTYDPKQRLTADQALRSNYFKELPLPIDPAMFPTWPAKSELGSRKALASSPKPPSGGGQFKKLGANDIEENHGFILGASMDSRQLAMGAGFSLKF